MFFFVQQQTEDDRPSAAKRPRAKPSVQDVNVEALAREGQVNDLISYDVFHLLYTDLTRFCFIFYTLAMQSKQHNFDDLAER